MKSEFIFTTPFEIEQKADGLVEIQGIISSTDQDLVNDVVTPNCLKSMLEQIKNRSIKLDLEHEAFKGDNNEETEINKTLVPIGRITDGEVKDNKQLHIKAVLNKYHKRYEEAKGSIVDKFIDAFSIAYIPTKVNYQRKNGEIVRLLDDVKLLNVALTGNPVNTHAQFTNVVLKSLDEFEEEKACKKKKKMKEDEDEDETEEKNDDSFGSEIFPDKTENKNPMQEYKEDISQRENLEVKNIKEAFEEFKTEIKSLIKSYSDISETNNQKEVKNMSEENETGKQEATENAETSEPQTEVQNESEAQAETKSALEELKAEMKALRDENSSLKGKLEAYEKSVENLNNSTNTKAMQNQMPVETETKAVEPLDLLK